MDVTVAADNMFDSNECTTNVLHSIGFWLALLVCRLFCVVGSSWENHHWQLYICMLACGDFLGYVSAFACWLFKVAQHEDLAVHL